MNLSNELKIIRQRSFLSQTEFAKRVKVSYTTVNRWEAGKAHPNLTAMKSIKDFCADQQIDFGPVQTAWLESKNGRVDN